MLAPSRSPTLPGAHVLVRFRRRLVLVHRRGMAPPSLSTPQLSLRRLVGAGSRLIALEK
jgi:hypothetical protein